MFFSYLGISEINFRINEKPTAGIVSVSPKSGIAYETNFSVSASGFYDYEDRSQMRLYKFGYKLYENGPITWFYEGSKCYILWW